MLLPLFLLLQGRSTLLVKPPSNDRILTKIVIVNPKNHAIPDFIKLDNFPIWILSDKLDTIPNTVAIKVIGSTNNVIIFPIKITANIIIGWINVTDATLPCSWH